jgi:hypothetical protein
VHCGVRGAHASCPAQSTCSATPRAVASSYRLRRVMCCACVLCMCCACAVRMLYVLCVVLCAARVSCGQEKCRYLGMDDVLVKPFRMAELVQVLARYIRLPTAISPGGAPTAAAAVTVAAPAVATNSNPTIGSLPSTPALASAAALVSTTSGGSAVSSAQSTPMTGGQARFTPPSATAGVVQPTPPAMPTAAVVVSTAAPTTPTD